VSILRDFERRLGGLVEGLFARTFRSGLQPVELAKRILKEMEQRRRVGVRGDDVAPNHFVFGLSPSDAEPFEQAERALVAELQQVVRDHAAERGWALMGPAHVELVVDGDLRKGEFRCDAAFEAGEEPAPEPAGLAELVIHEDAGPRSVSIARPVTTIGRLEECDVVVRDPGASRRHAEIRREDGVFSITDLGSTNGTLVNGRQVQSERLEEGDRIRIGSTVIEFRASSA
jgi:hypothetical protein